MLTEKEIKGLKRNMSEIVSLAECAEDYFIENNWDMALCTLEDVQSLIFNRITPVLEQLDDEGVKSL